VDGGSCERWEETGYGRGKVYQDIWQGNWEKYDPWESSSRLPVESDLYQGAGACSAFRAAQGWLSLSHCSAFEGTLLVNPLLQLATAYFLLRPFFTPRNGPSTQVTVNGAFEHANTDEYLSPDNWKLEDKPSSWLQGANLGRGQELNALLHPHLNLPETMVHIPRVQPGDYVVWHCDGIHAVDKIHAGKNDSSVLYIPACPLTERNAEYLVRQRDCFLRGKPQRSTNTTRVMLTTATQALHHQTSLEALVRASTPVARCKKTFRRFRESMVYAPWAWKSSRRTVAARQERRRSWRMQTGFLVLTDMAHGVARPARRT